MKRGALALMMAVVVGCGSDSVAPTGGDLSGTWMYSATNLAQGGVICSISGLSLTLTQSGNTFTGTVASGGSVFCRSSAGSATDSLSSDVVANGVLTGTSVEFDIGTQKLHNAGSIAGDSMSGTASLQVLTGGATTVLSGVFTAVKQ